MMLFTPGPVDVHPDILAAAGRAPLHHRSPEFLAMSDRVWKRLADTFQTSGPALLVSGSGMTGIEAAIASLHPRGSTVLILSHGRFGDRLPVIAERYGIRTVVRSVPWGQTITASMVGDALASSPDVDGVWMVHAETSTGVALDLQSIAQTIRAHAQSNR